MSYSYTNIHRARDVAETILALFEATPPEPITAESSGRQIVDNLTKHGLLDSGGDFGQWRPIPAGLYMPIESLAHMTAVIEYLSAISITAETAAMVAAHLVVRADVAANLARLKLCARGMESPEYQE